MLGLSCSCADRTARGPRYPRVMSTAQILVTTKRRIYVTADTHFGHEESLAIFARKFASVEEMDSAFIDRINEVVGAKDILIHLGDFTGPRAWNAAEFKRVAALRDRIVCRRIHLVRGNHDPLDARKFDRMFESVDDYISARGIATIDERLVLFHYPIEQWQGRPNGGFHLHGHVHGHGEAVARRCDVGVDAAGNNMRPQLLSDLVARLRQSPASGFVRIK